MKDNRVTIRLSDEQYKALLIKAEASNKKISEYIRDTIVNSEVKADTKKDYIYLIGAVNKIGNNLNQIAYNLNYARNRNKIDDIDYDNLLASLLLTENAFKNILEECK